LTLLLILKVGFVPYESYPRLNVVFTKSRCLKVTRHQNFFEISIPTQMQVSRRFIHKYFHHDKSPPQNLLHLIYHLKNHLSYRNFIDFKLLQAVLYPLAIMIFIPLLISLKILIYLAQRQFLFIFFLIQPTQDILFLIL